MNIDVKKATVVQEGISGKQLVKSKIEANRMHKEELRSLSFNLKQLKKHGSEFLKLNKLKAEECTPANLLEFLTDKERERVKKDGERFTFWLLESLCVRYAKKLQSEAKDKEAKAQPKAKQVQRTAKGKVVTA